jgi:hypothetical protein
LFVYFRETIFGAETYSAFFASTLNPLHTLFWRRIRSLLPRTTYLAYPAFNDFAYELKGTREYKRMRAQLSKENMAETTPIGRNVVMECIYIANEE